MPRDFKASEMVKRLKSIRSAALARNELRQPTSPRIPAAGATSMAIKAEDPAIRAMIDAEIEKRRLVKNGDN